MRTFEDDSMWTIEPLEVVGYVDTKHLREREQAWIDHLNPVLNGQNAVREAA
jgi:hypothetical protein